MKFQIFFTFAVFLVLGANATPLATQNSMDFGEAMALFFNKLKQQMFCGFSGQKAMVPMTVPSASFSKQTPELSYNFSVSDLYVSGSSNFEVVASKYDNITKQYYIHMNVPRSQVLGQYSLNTTVTVAGLPINIFGNGFVDVESQDSRCVITFNLVNDATTGKLAMANLTFSDFFVGQCSSRNTGLMGDVNFDKFANKLFEDTNNPYIFQLIEKYVLTPLYPQLMDMYNPMLGQFKTVDELTAALITAIGPDDKGLFGLPLCMIRY